MKSWISDVRCRNHWEHWTRKRNRFASWMYRPVANSKQKPMKIHKRRHNCFGQLFIRKTLSLSCCRRSRSIHLQTKMAATNPPMSKRLAIKYATAKSFLSGRSGTIAVVFKFLSSVGEEDSNEIHWQLILWSKTDSKLKERRKDYFLVQFDNINTYRSPVQYFNT